MNDETSAQRGALETLLKEMKGWNKDKIKSKKPAGQPEGSVIEMIEGKTDEDPSDEGSASDSSSDVLTLIRKLMGR